MTLVVAVVVVVPTLIAMRLHEGGPAHFVLAGWALIAVGCGALYFRRRWPVGVAVVTLLASAAYYPLSVYDGPLMITFALALHTTSAEGRLAAAVALGGVTLLAAGFGECLQHNGIRTGKVITAAAAIMIVVFAAFILSPDRMLQQFGLGLAVAILLDAVVIRCLIVPAVMQLLGRRAWWLPSPLRRVLPEVEWERQ